MNEKKIIEIVKGEIKKKLKESRADQLRRELDNAVNGTDFGHSSIKPGDDEQANRFKALEIDDKVSAKVTTIATEQEPVIKHHKNGQVKSTAFYNENGQLHRTDGPAVAYWYENGQKEVEYFCVNDRLHRTDGPAVAYWYENGQKETEYFYVNDELLSREEWQSRYGRFLNRNYLDLDEPTEDHKSMKDRRQSPDPRFAGLDLDGESEGMKPFNDKELEARGRALELDDDSPVRKKDRFKPSIGGHLVSEKRVILNKTKTRLIVI